MEAEEANTCTSWTNESGKGPGKSRRCSLWTASQVPVCLPLIGNVCRGYSFHLGLQGNQKLHIPVLPDVGAHNPARRIWYGQEDSGAKKHKKEKKEKKEKAWINPHLPCHVLAFLLVCLEKEGTSFCWLAFVRCQLREGSFVW